MLGTREILGNQENPGNQFKHHEQIFQATVAQASVKTGFERKGNCYTMGMWIPIPEKKSNRTGGGVQRDKIIEEELGDQEEHVPMEIDQIKQVVEEAGWTLIKTKESKKKGFRRPGQQ